MKKVREGGFLIAKIHHLSERTLSRILKKHDLDRFNPAQGRILFVLWREDGISIRELGKRTSLEKSTLTSMLDRLEDAGVLVRVPSREDRRKILIKLTDKDTECRGLYDKITKETTDLFYKGFSPTEIDRFEASLRRILDNLASSGKVRADK